MSETIKEWLIAMYEQEIENTNETIDNEIIWSNGSPDQNSKTMHMNNVEELESYIEILKSKIEEIKEN